MVKVRTGRRWKQEIGRKAFYSPYLDPGRYYMLKSYSHSRDFAANIYVFEEVEIID